VSPFVTDWQAKTFAIISAGGWSGWPPASTAAVANARERLLKHVRRHCLGRYVFVRRKGAARPGRKHSLHGKIIALDGQRIHVEYHTELGKHLEWFAESEAHIFVCERS